MVNEGKENFKNFKEEELNISAIELERKIKYALLDILKEDLAYNYKTSIKYSKSLEVYKNMFANRIKDYELFEEKSLIILNKIICKHCMITIIKHCLSNNRPSINKIHNQYKKPRACTLDYLKATCNHTQV